MTKTCDLIIFTTDADQDKTSFKDRAIVIEAEARYYHKRDKHYLLFELDNDRCRIEYDEKGLIYKRSGELTYEMQLYPGNSSSMRLKTAYGVMETEYSVSLYEAEIGEDRAEINIDYRSEGNNYSMRIETINYKNNPDNKGE
ncbi:MAG: DUF1934 domain-containing protein [Lachnospiraceae bacterium]|nr:DUF1934 domain-containing protein [Lachnospiraceae bacterium]